MSEILPPRRPRKPRGAARRHPTVRSRLARAAALGLTAVAVCGGLAATALVTDDGLTDMSSPGTRDIVRDEVSARPGIVDRTEAAASGGDHPASWDPSLRREIEGIGTSLSGRMASRSMNRVSMRGDLDWHVPRDDALVRVTTISSVDGPEREADLRRLFEREGAEAVFEAMMGHAHPVDSRSVSFTLRSSLDREGGRVAYYHGATVEDRPATMVVPVEGAGPPRLEFVETVPGPTVRRSSSATSAPTGCTLVASDGEFVEISFGDDALCMSLPLHPDGSVSVPWDALDEACPSSAAEPVADVLRADGPCTAFELPGARVTVDTDDYGTTFTATTSDATVSVSTSRTMTPPVAPFAGHTP